MARRITKHGDDFVHFEESARPAVGDHQRHGIRPLSLLVDEVDVQSVYFALEMGEGVDQLLLGVPIELSPPVLYQLFDVIKVAAVIPAGTRKFVGPPSALQPRFQVVEDRVRNFYLVRLDGHSFLSYVSQAGRYYPQHKIPRQGTVQLAIAWAWNGC